MAGVTGTIFERRFGGDMATFYYFLVGTHGSPHQPAVLATQVPERHIGEVIVLEDGSRVRVHGIEKTVGADLAGRGFDGVLVVEKHEAA